MTISDETLAAYVDGELGSAERAEVEAAAAADPGISARLRRQQRLKSLLISAFDPVTREETPERLLAAVEGGRRSRPAQIVQLSEVRAARAPPAPKRLWPSAARWGSLAATLIAGVLIGRFALTEASLSPIRATQEGLVVQGNLGHALDDQLAASQPDASAPLRVGISFRSQDNRFCRTFQTRAARPRAGVACREDGGWRIRMITDIPASTDGGYYHTASSDTPPLVLQSVESMISGQPMDAAAERQAQRNGWRARP